MPESFDLVSWIATRKPAEPDAAVAPQKARGASRAAKGDRLAKYLDGALEAACKTLESAPNGDRNNTLNLVAVNLGELIGPGRLSQGTVETSLTEIARRIGLPDHDIIGTLRSGLSHGMLQPRDLTELSKPAAPLPPSKPPTGALTAPAEDDGGPNCLPGFEENPHRLANTFLREQFNHKDGKTLRFWGDEFHSWTEGAYRPQTMLDLKAAVSKYIHEDYGRIYYNQLMAAAGPNSDGKVPKPIPVTTNVVGHVAQALSGITALSITKHPEQPCWIEGEDGWPIEEIMPMRKSIVHLPSYAAGLPCERPATPRLFCGHSLDYDFDPHAPEPTRWLAFLNQLWPDDPESISTLQEWMGLNLVPDIRYQKIMWFVGQKRAGKGVIAGILEALVGKANCCGPTIEGFEDTFGMQDFVGKLTAIFDDVRISSKANHAIIAGRLLTISGGGRITIRRMYRPGWTGRLSTRITMMSNLIPRFTGDESGVLADRFLVLKFSQSFFGREDLNLEEDLKRLELPGILKWAMEGWARLRARGRLIQPESGKEESGNIKDLASPISAFVHECCEIGPEQSCLCSDAYRAWRGWCEEQGRKEPGEAMVFGRNLRSVLPALVTTQIRIGKTKPRHYVGLALKSPLELTGNVTEAPEFDFTNIDTNSPF